MAVVYTMTEPYRIPPDREGEWRQYRRSNGQAYGDVLRYFLHVPTQRMWFNRPGSPDVLHVSVSYPSAGEFVRNRYGWVPAIPSCIQLPEGA